MATKKKELLEQDAPVTETVMSEDETLLADTAQPESLPAAAGDGLDLNELLGQMDQPQEDTSAEDMAEDPLPELTEKITPMLCRNPLHLPSPNVPAERRKKLLLLKKLSQRKSLPRLPIR